MCVLCIQGAGSEEGITQIFLLGTGVGAIAPSDSSVAASIAHFPAVNNAHKSDSAIHSFPSLVLPLSFAFHYSVGKKKYFFSYVAEALRDNEA